MSIQQPSNRETDTKSSRIKVRHVEVPPELKRFLMANSEYKNRFKTPSDDELRELPTGVLLTQIGIARSITSAGPLDHVQLICYRQPLLDNHPTDYFLRTVIDNKEGRYAKDVQEYVRASSAEMLLDFPFAFQMAYDIHTTGTITDKTRERKKVVDDRFADIANNL